jgi:hypothetical protein
MTDKVVKKKEEAPQEEQALTVDQAYTNVDLVCGQFKGNRQEHQAIVASLNLIRAALNELTKIKQAEAEEE